LALIMNVFDYGRSPAQLLNRATIGATASGWTLRVHSLRRLDLGGAALSALR
jgi:hypothetical protein